MKIISVSNLTKTYITYKRGSGFKDTLISLVKREKVSVKAVDNISFTVEKGRICGLLGPNGAGKSTIIKMLCGALYPTQGDIDVFGYKPSADRKKYVSRIGAVFGQRSQLIRDIPPIDSFNMNRAIYRIPESDYNTRLNELAEMFGVTEIMLKPTRTLSLGERMKCEFIMAMLHRPRIVFLDESTIGLDVIAKAQVRDFIKKINADGTTFILTTNDLEDVKQLADDIIIINNGVKVFDGTLKSLQQSLGDKKIVELTLAEPLPQNPLLSNKETEITEQPKETPQTTEITEQPKETPQTTEIPRQTEQPQDNSNEEAQNNGALSQENKPPWLPEGTRIIKLKSPCEPVIEVDIAQISIADFMQTLSSNIMFTDISVKELPMEEIITQL